MCVQTLHDTVSAPAGRDFSPCRRLIQCYYLYHLGGEREGKGGLEWHYLKGEGGQGEEVSPMAWERETGGGAGGGSIPLCKTDGQLFPYGFPAAESLPPGPTAVIRENFVHLPQPE